MKTSLKIAEAELRTLFYSPIAWFLTIIFIFQSALSFTSLLTNFQTLQDLGGGYLHNLWYLSNKIYGTTYQPDGLFNDVLKKVYLYIPLITMGLISREISSGTIKLLYSSPVKVKEIVAGKFIAMIIYSCLLIFVLLVYVLTGAIAIQSPNVSAMLAGLLGIFLLLCTYSAIGMFMSCLTAYQVVAALSTLVVLAVLNYIGNVWQGVDLVRNLTYFLSLSNRTDHMINGLISSKDVIYFIVIIFMFLCFSYFKLSAERSAVNLSKKIASYILTFVVVLVIGYLSDMPCFIVSYDATATKMFTLHPNTLKIVKDLGDEPLEITSYINLLDQNIFVGLPERRNEDLDRWEPYMRAKNNITLKYVYYYDSPGQEQQLLDLNKDKSLKKAAEKYAKSLNLDLDDFKSPEEIRKIVNLRSENNRYVMQLKYKGKTTFLRLFDDPAVLPFETEVAAALKRLTVSLPQIVFVESELERGRNPAGDRDYGLLANGINIRESLINQGFDTKSISLFNQDIPANITALVIAGPKTAFTPASMVKIQEYINAGGNLLIAGDPDKQHIINPIINTLGVRLMDGELTQNNDLIKDEEKSDGPSMGSAGVVVMTVSAGGSAPVTAPINKGLAYDLIFSSLTPDAVKISWNMEESFKTKSPVSMKGAAALSYNLNGPFKVVPLLMTDQRISWIKRKKFAPDSAAVTYSSADGDTKGSFPTMLALSRKVNGKEQRIILAGNSDFLSNLGLKRQIGKQQANADFGIGLFNWFSNGQFPIDTRHVDPKDIRLKTTAKQITVIKVVYMGIFPGLLLIGGAIFLIRRKRK